MNKRVLSFVCSVCPFCITARAWPKSGFAKKLREAEKNCPACRAYRELHADRGAQS